MNAGEAKQLASELEQTGFARAVIDQALAKVNKNYKRDAAAQWCVDWILAHPDGEKPAAAKPAGGGGGGGGGGGAMDMDDPLAPIMAMGFSRDDAKAALEEHGDPTAAIDALLAEAERREEQAKKAAEAKKAADEKAAKEQRAKDLEAKKASRLKLMVTNLFKTVCSYKKDAKTDDRDRVSAIFVLSTLYEPIEEELKNPPPAPSPVKGKGGAAAAMGKPKPTATATASASASASASGGGAKDSKSGSAADPKKKSADCTVCRGDWDADLQPAVFGNCGHAVICNPCLTKYVAIKVRDKEILPWIPCSAADCKVPLHPKDIVNSGITTEELYSLLRTYCTKLLARESQWVECTTKHCGYGFWLDAKEVKEMDAKNATKKGTGYKLSACGVCKAQQKVAPKVEELDAEFKKMLAEGKLRPCPKCQLNTMKEFGVCNVIECAKCGIWWNWRSRETGRTSKELKDRARSKGTLWEAGELEFQQKLERTNHAEFVKLLERNGVKYDPNYHRGTG